MTDPLILRRLVSALGGPGPTSGLEQVHRCTHPARKSRRERLDLHDRHPCGDRAISSWPVTDLRWDRRHAGRGT